MSLAVTAIQTDRRFQQTVSVALPVSSQSPVKNGNPSLFLPDNVPVGDVAGWNGNYQCQVGDAQAVATTYSSTGAGITTLCKPVSDNPQTMTLSPAELTKSQSGKIYFDRSSKGSKSSSNPVSNDTRLIALNAGSTNAIKNGSLLTIADAAKVSASAALDNSEFSLLDTFFRGK